MCSSVQCSICVQVYSVQYVIVFQDDICDPVRCFANLPEHTPLLTILDFPEQKVYICKEKQNITTDIVSKFVKDYLSETLPSQPIRQSSGEL